MVKIWNLELLTLIHREALDLEDSEKNREDPSKLMFITKDD